MRSVLTMTIVVSITATVSATAKPIHPVRHAAAKVAVPAEPVAAEITAMPTVGGMMTPKEAKLRPTTPVETEANAVWSTRAALNIAALQCQFSPFLATVRNYNDFLRQHAEELDRARSTMIAHFKRYDGTQAQNSFDRYTTQTYNGYTTLDAQYAFCREAGLAGSIALGVRKGALGRQAGALHDQIRAALVPISPHALIGVVEITPVALPEL